VIFTYTVVILVFFPTEQEAHDFTIHTPSYEFSTIIVQSWNHKV